MFERLRAIRAGVRPAVAEGRTRWALVLSVLALLAPAAVVAQGEARVSGTVRSQAGLSLPAVAVGFGAEGAAVRTDERGRFVLRLPAGAPVVLRIAHPGYVAERLELAPLAAGAERVIAVTLAPLYTLDALTVTAGEERPLLNTDDATTGGAIEPVELPALPTDARQPLALAFTLPGVAQATGFFGDAPPLTIGGGNALYTQYLLDGLDNNEGFLGGPRVEFPLSALRQLEVKANTYSTEWGRSPNGVVNMETRAGGGEWRGELFVFDRPGIPFDAEPKHTPPGTDPDGFRRLQVGGSLGGPLREDRTFLFAAVEFTDESEDRIGSTARTEFLGTEDRETWKLFGRLDHGWSPSQTTTLRFAYSDVTRAGQGGGVIVPEADITTIRRGSITSLTHRSAFRSGRSANELSVQLGTFRWDFPPTESDLRTPQVTVVSADSVTTEAVVGSSNFVFDERELQLQLKDVFEAQLGGGHTLRLGADVTRSAFELTGAGTNPRGAYTVINEGDIRASGPFLSIDDIPSDARVLRYTIDASPQQVDLTQTLVGAFVADRWRVSPSLTVHLGLRWDYDDITSRGESDPDLDNVQPRGSFNWYATPSSVLRGGAGLYAGKFPYAVYSDAVQFGADGNAVVTFEGERFPPPAFGEGPTAAELAALEGELPPREVRRMFALGLEQPTSFQATLGYQRQLGEHWSVALDAVWMETWNLPRSWDLNAIQRPLMPGDTVNRTVDFGDRFRPVDPATSGFRRLTTTESGGESEYRALYTTVRGEIAGSWSVDGTWVWSRARNDTEDINFNAAHANDFEAEWADAINDRRHKVTVRSVFTGLDDVRLSAIADFQTGTPINRVAHFRDLDGSGPIFGNGFVGNHDRFFGVPRNGERLPGAFRLDGSAVYLLGLPQGDVELRLDVFNVFNSTLRTGFANGIPGGGPRTQVGRPGDPIRYSTAAPPRQLQLSARWVF